MIPENFKSVEVQATFRRDNKGLRLQVEMPESLENHDLMAVGLASFGRLQGVDLDRLRDTFQESLQDPTLEATGVQHAPGCGCEPERMVH